MKVKKIFALAMTAVMGFSLTGALAGCKDSAPNATPTNTDPYDIPQDYCRTYYEVFVRSFADGNGDGIGDLRGLADNLDYLNDGDDSTTTDLGVNGIWMMPINASPTYHKYDVTDYYDIYDEYGTLEDFDYLVEKCNERDIWLQMDLVLNHTSAYHPWFKAAIADAKAGKTPEESAAMQRYEIVRADSQPTVGKWSKLSGTSDYWYLCNFSPEMPDVNLLNPEVREEIKKIVDFWLERGIKSFRLDAVPWACATDVMFNEENGEFWSWFNDYCNEKGAQVAAAQGWANDGIGRYCYNVGEVWGSNNSIPDFFGTGMSNFNYAMGGSPSVGFADATVGWVGYKGSSVVNQLVDVQKSVLEKDEHAILSNFLSNHDNARSAGFFDYDALKIKKAAGLYLLAPGNPYIYYGEELGMGGSGKDENMRLAFNWGDGRTVGNPPNSDYEDESTSWKSQTTDYNSILTYYRNAIKLRNRFPEIGRGVIDGYALDSNGALKAMTTFQDNGYTNVNAKNSDIAAYMLTWKDRKIFIVHNIGESELSVNVSDVFDGACEVVGTLKASGGDVALTDGELKLSAATVAVLKAK